MGEIKILTPLRYAIVPLREYYAATIVVAVACSEFSRFLFWLIWTKGHESLNQDAGRKLDTVTNLFWESVAAGLGTGLTSSLILYAGVLWSGWGPGTLLSESCFSCSFFIVGAITALSWTILHVGWTILCHRGYLLGKLNIRIFIVVVDHLIVSYLTMFNAGIRLSFGCVFSFLSQWISIILMALFIYRDFKTKPLK